MNKAEFIYTCTKEFEAGDTFEFELTDGYRYTISESNYWVGGYDDHFGCDIMGNIAYDDYEYMINRVADYIYDELGDVVTEVTY